MVCYRYKWNGASPQSEGIVRPNQSCQIIKSYALLEQYEDEGVEIKSYYLILSGYPTDTSRKPIKVLFHPISRLPISTAYRYNDIATDFHQTVQSASAYALTSVLTSGNSNLSDAEKEHLRWHFRLGHISFTKVQHLMRSGILSHSDGTRRLRKAAASLRHAPRCAACSFAKQYVLLLMLRVN